jgi:hypothetical protein
MQSDLITFIEARMLRKRPISAVELSQEIEEQFGVSVSRGFERRLELCLAKGRESISNQLWYLSERHATKDFFEAS